MYRKKFLSDGYSWENIKIFYLEKSDATEDENKMKLNYFNNIMQYLWDIKESTIQFDFLCVKNINSNPIGYETYSYFEYNGSKINNLSGNIKKEFVLYDYGIYIFGMKVDKTDGYEIHNKKIMGSKYKSEGGLMILADEKTN